VDDKLGQANTLRSLGQWHAFQGDLYLCKAHLDEARGIYEDTESAYGESEVLLTKALLAIKGGDVDSGRAGLEG